MNTIKVQRGLGTLTIKEEKINELLDNLSIIESILLMYRNGDDTFENQWEVDFPREEADRFLLNYFLKNTDYSKDYIVKTFTTT